MIFTQSAFVVFALIVIPLYFTVRNNLIVSRYLLLIASYVFYGWADWRFAILLFISSAFDFLCALKIDRASAQKDKTIWFWTGITFSLSILCYFKYYTFIASSINYAADRELFILYNIVLPAGISFYTFQSMSYLIDVKRGVLKPTASLPTYLLFVSYFPQLVAGPIERATHLLPQFYAPRRIDPGLMQDGFRQVLAGFIMKVVVADNLSPLVDAVYQNPQDFNAVSLLVATLFFSFQIYCDFAGYSNIAIGLGKIMGFDIMQNFRTPYFATSLTDFWRRWHISLSTFFRDYVYQPLGGSRVPYLLHMRNLIVVFAISGLWHGANWTFVAWGLYHGIGLTVSVTLARLVWGTEQIAPSAWLRPVLAVVTQVFVLLGWIYFRSNTIADASLIFGRILDPTQYGLGQLALLTAHLKAVGILGVFIGIDFIQRRRKHLLEIDGLPPVLRLAVYLAAVFAILLLGSGSQAQFIYFRF